MSLALTAASSHYATGADWSVPPYVVSLWVKATGGSGNEGVLDISRQHISAGIKHVRIMTANAAVQFKVNGATLGVLDSGSATGGWDHILAHWTFDGLDNAAECELNGSAGTPDTASGGITQQTTPDLYVGANHGIAAPGDFFDGFVSEIGVWTSDLNSFDRSLLLSGARPSTVSPATLIHYWPLLSDLLDDKGSNDLTAQNGVSTDADHPTMFNATQLNQRHPWDSGRLVGSRERMV